MGAEAELMGLFYDIKSAGVLVYDQRDRVFHSHERAFAQLPAALR